MPGGDSDASPAHGNVYWAPALGSTIRRTTNRAPVEPLDLQPLQLLLGGRHQQPQLGRQVEPGQPVEQQEDQAAQPAEQLEQQPRPGPLRHLEDHPRHAGRDRRTSFAGMQTS